MGMYTKPGQQGDEELRRDLQREPTCGCGHIIWLHSFMADGQCNAVKCSCIRFQRALEATNGN